MYAFVISFILIIPLINRNVANSMYRNHVGLRKLFVIIKITKFRLLFSVIFILSLIMIPATELKPGPGIVYYNTTYSNYATLIERQCML